MLTRFIWRQLILFSILSVITAIALGWYYLRIPSHGGDRPVHPEGGPARVGRSVQDGQRDLSR